MAEEDSLKMEHQFDVKVEKEDVKSIGAKGKGIKSDLSIEEDCPGLDVMDFISKMPDPVLVDILSRLPLNQAVTTGVLSPRWRFLWCSLKKLEFVGSTTHSRMCGRLYGLERAKYINQVNSVIGSLRSQNSPMLQSLKIVFDLDKTCLKDIDNWIRFALDKKVEVLELDFSETVFEARRGLRLNYDFALPLSNGNMVHLSKCPSSSSTVVGNFPFNKLFFTFVNVCDLTLKLLLKNSPKLEMFHIHGSALLTDVDVGGRDINLKQFTLSGNLELQSVSLHDCDLEKFHYVGDVIVMRLRNLPKIKEICIGLVNVGLNNNVFRAISSIASNLEVLNLYISRTMEDLNVEAIPRLPNVKTLKLTIPTEERDSLIAFLEIPKKCPKLENFAVSVYWWMPITENKTVCTAVAHSFPHLTYLQICGYRGLASDFQIALYMIGNAADTLETIVIDPSPLPNDKCVTPAKVCLKREKVGRSHAKSELSRCVPPWVDLIIL